ncbi:MAG: phosphoenolpyruvate carboxylase, partial [Solirubrobacteraceae bacterium]|nr:phosphoenolpyruvate carboxylase [Solirubrobacteraceae bacterium]
MIDVAATTLAQRTFADDEALLGGVLDEVIRAVEGPRALELHLRAVELGQRSRGGEPAAADELAQLVASLPLDDLVLLIRMLTGWFALMNLAEDNDRVRRIRALNDGSTPRRGSLHEAIVQLSADGTTA